MSNQDWQEKRLEDMRRMREARKKEAAAQPDRTQQMWDSWKDATTKPYSIKIESKDATVAPYTVKYMKDVNTDDDTPTPNRDSDETGDSDED